MAFLVDSSGSIGTSNFEKQKKFLKSVARTLSFGSGIARVGALVYSDVATIQFSFKNCSGSHTFMRAMEHIPYYGRTTRIDRALSLANTELFSKKGGVRPYVAKTLLLLTDGRQTQAPDSVSLERAVKPLKDKKVSTLTLGIGNQTNVNELRALVDDDDDVLAVASFDDLFSSLHSVSEMLCAKAGEN